MTLNKLQHSLMYASSLIIGGKGRVLSLFPPSGTWALPICLEFARFPNRRIPSFAVCRLTLAMYESSLTECNAICKLLKNLACWVRCGRCLDRSHHTCFNNHSLKRRVRENQNVDFHATDAWQARFVCNVWYGRLLICCQPSRQLWKHSCLNDKCFVQWCDLVNMSFIILLGRYMVV